MITSGTTKNNKWQRVVQRVTASNTASGNQWQRVTTSDNGGTTNDNDCQNEWKRMRVILGFRIKQLFNVYLQYAQQRLFEYIM